MCLAVPGLVIEVEGEDPAFRHGRVDFSGVRKDVSFAYTPEIQPGDYVLVHVGFAIQTIDREEARRNLRALNSLLSPEDIRLELQALWPPGAAPDRPGAETPAAPGGHDLHSYSNDAGVP